MSLCRTCLSKNDLRPIFPDKDRVVARSIQLNTVTGTKINPNDGLTQVICTACIDLINAALKLREQSLKSEEILKNSKAYTAQHDIKLSKRKVDTIETDSQISDRKDIKIKPEKFEREEKICIEDFESSNDSHIIDAVELEDLDGDEEEKKVRIEDFESSDSFDSDDLKVLKEDTDDNYKKMWEIWEEEFLERQRKRSESKALEEKLMALAVNPYDPGGPIRCTICRKELRNVQNFKSHAKTHFGPQVSCEECGKKFYNRSHMRYHQQRVHGRVKRLACSQCDYRAVDPQQLQNHERATHTGERPYICDVCGDSFRMRANIAQHMRKHFGVRNLQCERCPAMFRSRSELTNHQSRVHNHIYTYFCYLCPETYKRPASVRKHVANVHGVPKNQQMNIIKSEKTKRRSCDKSE